MIVESKLLFGSFDDVESFWFVVSAEVIELSVISLFELLFLQLTNKEKVVSEKKMMDLFIGFIIHDNGLQTSNRGCTEALTVYKCA